MKPRKQKSKTESDIYAQRFNSLGLELPEMAAANPAVMRSIAVFLLKNEVFTDELDGLDSSQAGSAPPAPPED